MNSRQRFIASCINPYYNNFASREEVQLARKLARGRYWNESNHGSYCSYTPCGIRTFFHYDDNIKLIAKKAARLWAKGKCEESRTVYALSII